MKIEQKVVLIHVEAARDYISEAVESLKAANKNMQALPCVTDTDKHNVKNAVVTIEGDIELLTVVFERLGGFVRGLSNG